MRIRVIVPVSVEVWNEPVKKLYESIADSETVLEIVNLKKGPEVIEGHRDHDLAIPYVIKEVLKAEKNGVDGVIIYCCTFPRESLREVCRIPVISIWEASMLLATGLGRRFSVLAPTEFCVPLYEHNAQTLGIESKLASVRVVNIPILELVDTERVKRASINEGRKAVEEDGAHVIMFGCGSMLEVQSDIQKELGVPVIDCGGPALKMMETIIKLGLTHSKKSYKTPPEVDMKFIYY